MTAETLLVQELVRADVLEIAVEVVKMIVWMIVLMDVHRGAQRIARSHVQIRPLQFMMVVEVLMRILAVKQNAPDHV